MCLSGTRKEISAAYMPESGKIGIVHPVEVSDESKEAWKEQLEDNEVNQPIEQLGRPTYGMGDEEQKKLGWYEGWVVEGDLLKRRLREQGWYEIWEEDVERGYAKMNEELSLGVELVLRYNWDDCDYENMTVMEAKFYTGDVYGVPCEDDFCLLKEVPDRYYSEVVLSLSRAIE